MFPLFQWHACKLAKLSACLAKCMTSTNKIYIRFKLHLLSMEKDRRQTKGGLLPASSRDVGAGIYFKIFPVIRDVRFDSSTPFSPFLKLFLPCYYPMKEKDGGWTLPVAISFLTEDYFHGIV